MAYAYVDRRERNVKRWAAERRCTRKKVTAKRRRRESRSGENAVEKSLTRARMQETISERFILSRRFAGVCARPLRISLSPIILFFLCEQPRSLLYFAIVYEGREKSDVKERRRRRTRTRRDSVGIDETDRRTIRGRRKGGKQGLREKSGTKRRSKR